MHELPPNFTDSVVRSDVHNISPSEEVGRGAMQPPDSGSYDTFVLSELHDFSTGQPLAGDTEPTEPMPKAQITEPIQTGRYKDIGGVVHAEYTMPNGSTALSPYRPQASLVSPLTVPPEQPPKPQHAAQVIVTLGYDGRVESNISGDLSLVGHLLPDIGNAPIGGGAPTRSRTPSYENGEGDDGDQGDEQQEAGVDVGANRQPARRRTTRTSSRLPQVTLPRVPRFGLNIGSHSELSGSAKMRHAVCWGGLALILYAVPALGEKFVGKDAPTPAAVTKVYVSGVSEIKNLALDIGHLIP